MIGRDLRPAPEPMETDEVAITVVGTVLWAVALVVLAVFFRDELADAGRGWWVWTPAAGIGIGLFGTWYVRRRRDAIRRFRGEEAGATGGHGQEPQGRG